MAREEMEAGMDGMVIGWDGGGTDGRMDLLVA